VPKYLISPDDVVWHFIKTAPRARLLEHALFAIAAAMLGFALLLEINANPHTENQESHGRPRVTATVASLMQAIGIGSLLPLPGFLLLVVSDLLASLLFYDRKSIGEVPEVERDSRRGQRPLQAFRWKDALFNHIGLCLAFLSMAIFSVLLIDRVADVLFAMTALVSIAANCRLLVRDYR
jgi:hypothetical protein